MSLVIHITALFGIYSVPEKEQMSPETFLTRLVSPEEFSPPPSTPPLVSPEKREVPVPPLPSIKKLPVKPAVPPEQRRELSDEKPIVPGEGRDTGIPLPEGMRPEPGKEKKGKAETGEINRDSVRPGYTESEKLFDRRIIGDIARQDVRVFEDTGNKENSLAFDTREYRYSGYMKRLKEKIESIWVYPEEARRKGIYGDLKIRFTIKKNGMLSSIELVRTSGHKMLDEAAMKALKDGEPYWPLPDDWGSDSYTILGHFIYSFYGYYVR